MVVTGRFTYSDCVVVVLVVASSCCACRGKTKAHAQNVSDAVMGREAGRNAEVHSSKSGSGARAVPRCPSSPGHNADARQEASCDADSDPCTAQDTRNEGSICAQTVLEAHGQCQSVGSEQGLNQHQSPTRQTKQGCRSNSQNCLQTPARADQKVSKRQRAEGGTQPMPENDEPNHAVMVRGKRAKT